MTVTIFKASMFNSLVLITQCKQTTFYVSNSRKNLISCDFLILKNCFVFKQYILAITLAEWSDVQVVASINVLGSILVEEKSLKKFLRR